MHHRTSICLLGAPLLITLFLSNSWAAIRPSFRLDYSVWKASDIVVATEGQAIDGKLEVVETWKGNLQPGSRLELQELAMFADEQSRLVHWWHAKELTEPYVQSVTGSRMVLFLLKAATTDNEGDGHSAPWRPASFHGGFKVSVAWIERGEAYAYQQIFNPGPSRLEHLGTAIEMKARVASFVTIDSELEAAIQGRDPIRAGQAFHAFHRNKFHYAAKASLQSIGKMGINSLQTLRQLLNNITLRHRHPDIISAMVEAGGESVASDLTDIVAREFDFWSKQSPDLKAGWWNADPADRRRGLREHHSRLLQALRELEVFANAESRDVIARTRDLWQSNSALKEFQIVDACDAVLTKLSRDGTP